MAIDQSKVSEILVAAREAVDAAGLPEELRAVAFEKAVVLLAGGPVPPSGSAALSGETGAPHSGEAKTVETVAAKLGLPAETVGEVFHVENGELTIVLARSMFEETRAGATKQLALLIAAGRQAGGWDDQWTATPVIRSVVDEFGRLDPPNFASAIREMEDVFSFTGNRQNLRVKVRTHGFDEAAALVRALTGGEST